MRYRFGDCTMDLDLYELRREGETVEIQPKAFDVLRYLVEHAERTVPKEELLDSVWPGVVVGEAALTQAVRQVRRALGDQDGEDAIIRTVRRRGYRIGVPVAPDEAEAEPATSPPAPEEVSPRVAIERRLAALMSVDVVAYSRHMGQDAVRTVHTLTGHREEMTRVVAEHRGRVVDSPGDNLLAEFPSAQEATRGALEVQRAVRVRNEELAAEQPMELRIGVHLGDVLIEGERLYGDGVNVVARLERLAEPGGVCISSNVHEQLGAELRASFQDLGEQHLKNIDHPVRALRWTTGEPEGTATPEPVAGLRPRSPRQRRLVAAGGIAALLLLLAWLARPVDLWAPADGVRVATAPPDRSSIAVLPFVDLSTRGDEEYLAEGIAAELIHALSSQRGLRVVARTSSFAFKERDTDVREIATQLGVGTVLEGSVRREGGRLRVSVQLIDSIDGFHLWSESYDRRADDLFAVQEEITTALADKLTREVGVVAGPRPANAYEPDPRAYDAYLLGRAEGNLRTPESSERAVEHLERAIEVDPGYAAAHAELAYAHLIRIEFVGQAAWQAAEQAAERAVELDPSLPEVLAVLAQLRRSEFDWAGSEALYRRVLELSPGWAIGWEKYAGFLGHMGRVQEAVPAIRRALELDPLSPLLQRQAGRFLYYAGETDRAVPHLLRSLELNPGEEYAASLLFMAYEQKGMSAEAREALLRIAPGWTRPPARIAGRLLGTAAVLRVLIVPARWLSPPCTVRPTSGALLHAYLGDGDRMFECLDYILDQKRDIAYVKAHPFYDPYRADPRFVQMLRRAGLE